MREHTESRLEGPMPWRARVVVAMLGGGGWLALLLLAWAPFASLLNDDWPAWRQWCLNVASSATSLWALPVWTIPGLLVGDRNLGPLAGLAAGALAGALLGLRTGEIEVPFLLLGGFAGTMAASVLQQKTRRYNRERGKSGEWVLLINR